MLPLRKEFSPLEYLAFIEQNKIECFYSGSPSAAVQTTDAIGH